MFTRHSLLAASAVAVAALLVTASAHAFVTRHANHLTFSKPVTLPGITLPAGTYRFEVINRDASGDVVRVADTDRRRVYLMQHTLRVPRPHGLRPGQVVTFGEAPAGTPSPIRVWFPLDGSDGREFIY